MGAQKVHHLGRAGGIHFFVRHQVGFLGDLGQHVGLRRAAQAGPAHELLIGPSPGIQKAGGHHGPFPELLRQLGQPGQNMGRPFRDKAVLHVDEKKALHFWGLLY